jgi:hypothetical protein
VNPEHPEIRWVASGPGRKNYRQDATGVRFIEGAERDLETKSTFVAEQAGPPVWGRYFAVAVDKAGQRHVPDYPHFVEFQQSMGRKVIVHFDVPYHTIDHVEWVPFKERPKFYFDGIQIPAPAAHGAAVAGTYHTTDGTRIQLVAIMNQGLDEAEARGWVLVSIKEDWAKVFSLPTK